VSSSEQSAQQTNEAKSTLHFQTLPSALKRHSMRDSVESHAIVTIAVEG
jgi:hypothetical protein